MKETLCLVHDLPPGQRPAYQSELSKFLDVVAIDWRSAHRLPGFLDAPWLIDLGFVDAARAGELRELFRNDGDEPRLFVASPGNRADVVRARGLGATAVVSRPVDPMVVLGHLVRPSDRAAEARSRRRPETTRPAPPARTARRPSPGIDARAAPTRGAAASVSAATEPLLATAVHASRILERIFESCRTATPVDGAELRALATEIAPMLREHGLDAWLELVQSHHGGTYQHSLLVMGVAAAVGGRLGLAADTVSRLTIAGLLHDVGKCWIPESILSKPGRLSEREFAVVHEHSRLGRDALWASGLALPDDVLDAVLHHHEYLDGSGYPDRLVGEAIAPLARVLTVCDVFGALAEHRSYRPAFPPAEILQVLRTHARVGHVLGTHVDAIEACLAAPSPSGRRTAR